MKFRQLAASGKHLAHVGDILGVEVRQAMDGGQLREVLEPVGGALRHGLGEVLVDIDGANRGRAGAPLG